MMRYLPSVWPLKSNGGCRVLPIPSRQARIRARVGGDVGMRAGELQPRSPRAQPREQLHGSITRMPTKPSRVHPRFLVPDLDPASGQARLPPDESRHLTRVLRLVRVRPSPRSTDAATSFWRASTNARDTLVTVALLEPVEPAAGPIVPFVLVQGVIKGGGDGRHRPRRHDDGRGDHSAGSDRAHGGQAGVREAWGERRALAPHCDRVGEAVATCDAARMCANRSDSRPRSRRTRRISH